MESDRRIKSIYIAQEMRGRLHEMTGGIHLVCHHLVCHHLVGPHQEIKRHLGPIMFLHMVATKK